MRQGMDMTINQLPARTWNWLHMNEANLENVTVEAVCPAEADALEASAGLCWNDGAVLAHADAFAAMATGLGSDMTKLVAAAGVKTDVLRSAAGSEAGSFRIAYEYALGQNALSSLQLYAEENSVLTVAVLLKTKAGSTAAAGTASVPAASAAAADGGNASADLVSSAKAGNSLAAQQIKIYAERGAKVRLYLVQMLDEGAVCLGDVGGICEDDASIELVRMEIGAGKLYAGAEIDLAGKRSSFESHIGYRVKDSQHFDMNYTARHRGKKTESLMTASGVLEDGAFKLFRGTIDLQHGCAGAKGTESEDALLLGDKVVNQTIPLILCGEEDVEGNHGASIGRMDEQVLFYLSSRGLSREAAEQLIARAKLDAVCNRIPLESVREEVQTYLGGASCDEEL